MRDKGRDMIRMRLAQTGLQGRLILEQPVYKYFLSINQNIMIA